MSDLPAPSRPRRSPVPLSRVATRTCARPGCPGPARATLSFSYGERRAWLGPLSERPVPEHYDLCVGHADRTASPRGWELVDTREDGGDEVPQTLGEAADVRAEALVGRPTLAATDTVAVLAEALGRARHGSEEAGTQDDPRLFPLAAPSPGTEPRATTW